jgi:Phosphate-selective porin O and P
MRKLLLTVAVIACLMGGTAASAAEPGETTVGGKGYFDLTNIDATSDGTKTDATGTGIDVKRFYISVGHQFDNTWSANITTDFNYVSNDSETQLFVKKAYFEGKFSDAFTLRFGSTDVPLVPFVENLYGYRYVENVLVEHLHLEASADWGIHALGNFAGGNVHYAVSAISGNGYKNPSRSRSLDFDGRLDFEPIDSLTLALFYRAGKRGLDKESVTTFHTAQRSELLAAYVKPQFRVGLEYFQADNWNQVLSPLTDKADGYSVWGSIKVRENVSIFARYDDAMPSKELQPDLKNTYFNMGAAFQPIPKVDIAVVYKQDKVENGFYGTTNGTIGGTSAGKSNEIGVWAQVQF